MSNKESFCTKCGVQIRWCKTRNDKNMPVDFEPDPLGDFVISDGVVMKAGRDLADDIPRYTSHFATCLDADGYRRSK